jgi:tetratricopeptide (TPR) repeat protein
MMGVDQWFNGSGGGGNANGNGNRVFHKPVDPGESTAQERPERGSNQHSLDLAKRYLDFGDNHFLKQQYSDALERYRKAAQVAPQLADAYFRQGFALSAMGKYEPAAKAFKRGLEIDPDWADSDFRLTEIYGADDAAKKATEDALARAVNGEPNNGDLALLLGIHYYFDGKKDQAVTLLERASKVGGNDSALKGFLGKH